VDDMVLADFADFTLEADPSFVLGQESLLSFANKRGVCTAVGDCLRFACIDGWVFLSCGEVSVK
jgi:hypothetical protein